MGFFNMSEPSGIGYASVDNTQNFTDENLFEKLSAVKVSFGTPVMGDIKGVPAVMYKNVTPEFDVFARVDKSIRVDAKYSLDLRCDDKTAIDEVIRLCSQEHISVRDLRVAR